MLPINSWFLISVPFFYCWNTGPLALRSNARLSFPNKLVVGLNMSFASSFFFADPSSKKDLPGDSYEKMLTQVPIFLCTLFFF